MGERDESVISSAPKRKQKRKVHNGGQQEGQKRDVVGRTRSSARAYASTCPRGLWDDNWNWYNEVRLQRQKVRCQILGKSASSYYIQFCSRSLAEI